ncbi:hypothetical protein PT974_12397 [Cladobotryum mycophilum]|uniref:Heterokaryon incompatibility domain-containing protein n=1 Tax=Cladobotryum mycophilum TaxID=491253 RepID=A0ABR0S7W4_9HYPO
MQSVLRGLHDCMSCLRPPPSAPQSICLAQYPGPTSSIRSSSNQSNQLASTLAEEHILCSQCSRSARTSRLLPTLAKGTEAFRFYSDLNELQESSSKGCHLCSLFLGAFGYEITQQQRENRVEVSLYVSRSGGAWLKVFSVPSTSSPDLASSPRKDGEKQQIMGELSVFRSLEGYVEEPKPNSPFIFSTSSIYENAQLSKSLSFEASAVLAREWLRQCLQRHTKCTLASQIFPSNHGYPTRLLDVGGRGETDLVRLVITAELDKDKPEYLTLSHCWGGANILKLLTKNLNNLKRAIPFSFLPKTFQDAIIITRQLGFQYLWIDSLCIMQDSPSDWRSESEIMGEIYAHSTCTVAALTARSSSEGCFSGRRATQEKQERSVARNPLAFRLCNLPHGLHAECSQRLQPALQIDRKSLPLQTRAWVVQERLLAPRTLYYGAWGLAWECVECSATEGKPFGEVSQFSPKASFLEACVKASQADTPSEDKVASMYKMWLDVQASYTQCQLTFFDDRIIAVSSIIKKVESLISWTNVWGLWKERLLQELLWFVDTPSERPPTKEYLCPSWSWASIRGRVFIDRETFAEDMAPSWAAEVIETGTDSRGRGFLRLRAATKEVVASSSPGTELVLEDKDKSGYRTFSWTADTASPILGEKIFCLLLMRIPDYMDDRSFDVGLVVSRIGEETVRLGRFWQDQRDSIALFPNRVEDMNIEEVVIA